MAAPTGHRTVPHTADLRVEAWALTREACIAQAVMGAVEAFADTAYSGPTSPRVCRLDAESDEDLLVAVLDEVVYLMDSEQVVPVAVEVAAVGRGLEVRFAMAPAGSVPQVGAVPKAVSLHGLRLASDQRGWSCSVTLDV